jgi:hypothetical protein
MGPQNAEIRHLYEGETVSERIWEIKEGTLRGTDDDDIIYFLASDLYSMSDIVVVQILNSGEDTSRRHYHELLPRAVARYCRTSHGCVSQIIIQ